MIQNTKNFSSCHFSAFNGTNTWITFPTFTSGERLTIGSYVRHVLRRHTFFGMPQGLVGQALSWPQSTKTLLYSFPAAAVT